MKFNLDSTTGHTIVRYDVGEIQLHLNGMPPVEGIEKTARIVRTSAIITPETIIENWPPTAPAGVLPLHIQQVLEFHPEIVILGTGRSLRFPAQEVIQVCHQAGAGFEVMDTGAACRTYNILAGEGRRVAAALLMIEASTG